MVEDTTLQQNSWNDPPNCSYLYRLGNFETEDITLYDKLDFNFKWYDLCTVIEKLRPIKLTVKQVRL
ncbi:hypothetical protein H5410_057219 [Solanum commersonii]|uniref:Uncharacterized protein n=1 Tax=Solanum commersonii TaxID=4109 RepID=A0A9J5WP17_SOLCO|nr:hypothetical protein H5410_057219 [Solanum commersonii]